MNLALTLIERYVLEAINKKQKDLIGINNETGIEIRILKKVLHRLESLGLVHIHKDFYSVNIENIKMYSESKKIEVTNMMKEISLNSKQVSIKKVYLNQQDHVRIQSMFQDIETFISSRSLKEQSIKNKTVLYWGQQNYGELISNYIN